MQFSKIFFQIINNTQWLGLPNRVQFFVDHGKPKAHALKQEIFQFQILKKNWKIISCSGAGFGSLGLPSFIAAQTCSSSTQEFQSTNFHFSMKFYLNIFKLIVNFLQARRVQVISVKIIQKNRKYY